MFDEVLPSIRQHGAYLTREKLWESRHLAGGAAENSAPTCWPSAKRTRALREDNANCKSKAVYYDLFIDLHPQYQPAYHRQGAGRAGRRFVRFLLERRFVYRTPSGCVLPYAKSANDGLFCVRDYYHNGLAPYTLVTPKGKLHFAGLRDLILVTV